MRSLRSIAPAALAASMVVLAVGVVAGAPVASASPMCQWQPLSLQDGWQSEQSAWSTGDPAYCIDNGVVYLSGSLAQPSAGGNYVAQLPQQARPASNMYLSVYTYAGATGVVQINTDGTMYAYSGKATQFTSLAGISFPAASTAETPINLQYGWQSAQSQWWTGDPSYYVSNGVVHLSGSLYDPTGHASVAFAVLPPGARPAANQAIDVYSYGGVAALLTVDTDGMIGVTWGNAHQFTSLAGVTFPAASPGVPVEMPLTPLNGWTSGQATWSGIGPSYDISNGVVYLDGAVLNTGSGKVAVLPAAARPTHTLYLTVNISGYYSAILRIEPDGSMYTYGGPPSAYTSGDYTVFSGISYEAGS